MPAIASLDGVAARSGSGTIVTEPPGQALADVVVGLADEPQLDARAGERAEGLAGGAAQLQLDRAAQLAALEGAGERRRRTSDPRWSARSPAAVTEPWPRNAVAMPASSTEAWRVPDVAAGARGIGPARRRRRPTARRR